MGSSMAFHTIFEFFLLGLKFFVLAQVSAQHAATCLDLAPLPTNFTYNPPDTNPNREHA